MKTEKQIEDMKSHISDNISKLQERLSECKDEFSYNTISIEIKKLTAQYNILLEVLNG